MEKWNKQLYVEDVKVGAELPAISIPLTLQRLVMEASANYDLSLIHHDNEAAIATGATGAYANTFFIMGMIERMLREWMGLKGQIKKIGPLQMKAFNCVGEIMTFSANVAEVDADNGSVGLEVSAGIGEKETVSSLVRVELPKRS